MSRSPAVMAGAISQLESQAFDKALRLVAEAGPMDMSPALLNEVRACVENPQGG